MEKMIDYSSEYVLNLRKLIGDITDHVNTFTSDADTFNVLMSNEHRTLQQSFTKLCLQWLEHCATDEYRTDGRNEGSKKVAKEILEQWRKIPYYESYKPSLFLGCI